MLQSKVFYLFKMINKGGKKTAIYDYKFKNQNLRKIKIEFHDPIIRIRN